MKKTNYESLLDAFRELGDVSDEEVLTPQAKKLVKEGMEFALNNNGDLEAAKQALEQTSDSDEIEVIDVNADALEHVKDKKEYVGQVIVQCNKCHANKFIDMEQLVADEVDPELYNVEDECPNCHTEGNGFELVGQVAKVVTEEPTPEEPALEEPTPEEPLLDNTEHAQDDVAFENDAEEETSEEEDAAETADEEEASEEVDFKPEEESDGMETTTSEDDDELELPALGDEADLDDVRKDDTEEDEDDEEDEEEVKEELKQEVEEIKPVRRKLRLPTREALEKVRKARVEFTEELFNKFALLESIDRVIVNSGSKKLYEGVIEELPAEFVTSAVKGFDVANGYLMCNVDPVTDAVDTPLAKVLNCFTDDKTTKIIVWDADTNEELFQGSKDAVLAKFGHCQLVSLDAPKTLRLSIKGDHGCDCEDGSCTCAHEEEEVTPEAALLDKVFEANDLAKYNIDNQKSEEFWICESIYNKEDLSFVFERYIRGLDKKLVEEFKAVTGFKDELDEVEEKYNVKVTRTDEAFNKREVDEMVELATKLGIKTFAELQEFSKQFDGAKNQDLLAALRKEVERKTASKEIKEGVIQFKTRKALSEALLKVKAAGVQYKIKRSTNEGYRYDLIVEALPAADDLNLDDYMAEAKKVVKEVATASLAKVENLYYDDFQFDQNEPADEAEKIIEAALVARIKQLTGKEPAGRDYISPEEYIREAERFAEEIKNMSLVKAEEIYYDDYGFDHAKPEDEAEQIVFDALVTRIKDITTKEPPMAGKTVKEDFEEEDVEIDPESFELDEEFDEDTGDDFKDKIAFLTNDELEAIAGYEEVIEFFKEKGIDEDKIMDRLLELQADEEEHLDELKELFKAVTGEEMVEIPEEDVDEEEPSEEDVEPETELELVDVDPAEEEAPIDEAVAKEEEKEEEAEAELEEEPEAVPEEKEPLPDAIDVIKDKLDIEREGDAIIVAEKGKLYDEDAPKLEVEVTKEEAGVIIDEFNGEDKPEDTHLLSKEFLNDLVAKGELDGEIKQETPEGEPVEDDDEEQAETVEESYSRQELLDAVMDAFGFTKGEALEYIKKASEETKLNIIKGFKQDAKKNFYEGVSPKNQFLRPALDKLKLIKKAKGVVVSFRKPNGKEEEVGVVYYTPNELHELEKELRAEHGEDIDISAIHDRAMIDEYEQAMTEAVVDIKPFFDKVLEQPEEKKEDEPADVDDEIDFDTEKFDEDINRYFDEAYEETVLYHSEKGSIDKDGNIMLEGFLTSDNGQIDVSFKLTPEKLLSEAMDNKTFEEKVKSTTFKVTNNLSEEVFTFDFTSAEK